VSAEQARNLYKCSQKQASECGYPYFAMSCRCGPPGTPLGFRCRRPQPRTRERIEGLGEVLARSETVERVFCEAACNYLIERRRHCRIAVRRWHGIIVQNLRADGAERISVKRTNPGQHLVENNAERKLIRALILEFALNLFGGQIGGRAQQLAGSGKLSGQAGDTEIAEFYLVFRRDQDVSGLDVAMNDSRPVGQCEGAGQIRGPGASALNR